MGSFTRKARRASVPKHERFQFVQAVKATATERSSLRSLANFGPDQRAKMEEIIVRAALDGDTGLEKRAAAILDRIIRLEKRISAIHKI